MVKNGNEVEVPDEVTVCYGEQKFSPVQYQTFSVGPFFCKTHQREGETLEEAGLRAYRTAEALARAAYKTARDEFLERVGDADQAARDRAKRGRG